MPEKTFKFIYPRLIKPVTGGHRYEQSLRGALSNGGLDVETIHIIQKHAPLLKIDKILAPFLSLKLLKKINKKKDIVILNSTGGLYFSLLTPLLKFRKIPIIIIHHHYLYKEFSGLKRKLYHFIENTFLKSATHIITPSPYIRELISEEIKKDSKLLPIPFRRPEIHTRFSPNVGQLLYIGTIEPRKGLNLLIEAMNLTDDPKRYTLHIVGKTRFPEYKDMLENMISKYNLNVVFHGFLSDEELNKVIQTSDVFVFPSLLEGFGMAINEVKFYGLPAVCFNNSAMPYSTTDGEDGFVVKNKDTKEFAKAIDRICNDRNLRNLLSEDTKSKAQKLYSYDDFNRESVSIFSNLI